MLSLVAAWLVNIAHFLKLNKSIDGVERFRAKVRVKKRVKSRIESPVSFQSKRKRLQRRG
jgi:hypothetical protein